MTRYSKQARMLVAVDCIIFGFDGQDIKLLLIQRGFEPEKGKWSLMGGFVEPDESVDVAAARVLQTLTGLKDVYLEQLHAFGELHRDPLERVVSIVYFSLIDISKYEKQISHEYHAEWFEFKKLPPLIFDHHRMIEKAKEKLRYKAAFHPILFELLPDRFMNYCQTVLPSLNYRTCTRKSMRQLWTNEISAVRSYRPACS
jgi:8-oxo-dGTP diphosphatase